MGGVVGLDWGVAVERLKLHECWNQRVEHALSICEAAMLKTIEETRETNA